VAGARRTVREWLASENLRKSRHRRSRYLGRYPPAFVPLTLRRKFWLNDLNDFAVKLTMIKAVPLIQNYLISTNRSDLDLYMKTSSCLHF